MSPIPQSPITVHNHTLQTLQALLRPFLPHSLTILRRIQHPNNQTSDSFDVFATFPASPPPSSIPQHFAIGTLDRVDTGLQIFLFSSLELPTSFGNNEAGTITRSKNDDEVSGLHLSALFAHMHNVHSPLSSSTGTTINSLTGAKEKAENRTHQKDNLRIGCLSKPVSEWIRTHPASPVQDQGGPHYYRKYVFRVSDLPSQTPEDSTLPEGLCWSVVDITRKPDVDIVMRTNPFMRSVQTMHGLACVAIRAVERSAESDEDVEDKYHKGSLAAWVFLGHDGAIRTLHCEPEWRRKGLARKLVLRIIREKSSTFFRQSEPDDWGWGNVSGANVPSVGLFEHVLGARSIDECEWVLIDAAVF